MFLGHNAKATANPTRTISDRRIPLKQGCKSVHYRGADWLQPRVQDPQKSWILSEGPRVRIHLAPAKSQKSQERLKTAALLTGDRWFESISLQQTVRLSPAATFERQEPGLSPQVCEAPLTTESAETRQAFHCAPTGGNVSAGPYSSTAVPMMRSAQCHDGPNEVRTRAWHG